MTGVLISAVQEASCNVNDIHDDMEWKSSLIAEGVFQKHAGDKPCYFVPDPPFWWVGVSPVPPAPAQG